MPRAALLAAVAQRWPDLAIDAEALSAALDRLAEERDDVTNEDACVVALAIACASGDAKAVRAFEDGYFAAARRAAERIVGEPEADEIMQRLRERLFLAEDDAAPRAVAAAGRGDMAKFVRVAAVRLALNARRGDARRQRRHDAGLDAAMLDDPELSAVKSTLRTVLKDAFESAVASLTSQQRNMLRHHLLDHLSIDQLASRYGVHRATAARWLASARAEVAERTRAELRARLPDDDAATQAFELVKSRLELSITRVLAES